MLNQIKGLKRNGLKIADVGCGKGCYIKNLLEDVPDAQYFAVDLSEKVMKSIPICRYCDTFASEKIEWGVSHKEDSEWT